MNRSALLGATAALALVIAFAPGGTAQAAPAEEEENVEPLIIELPPDPAEAETAIPLAPPPRPAEPPVAVIDIPVQGEPSVAQGAPIEPAAVVDIPPQPKPKVLVAAPQPVPQPAPAPAPTPAQAQVEPPQQQSLAIADMPLAPDFPGVLTRRGALVIEPGIEYSHTDVNQFSFGGVAILDTVLVGAIEANQANRDAVTATLGLRYGITNRMEGELRIPYMYRDDSSTNTFVNNSNISESISLTDHGLGDIEGALHYQVNDGTAGWPVFVGNFRVKSDSGTSPYDVDRNMFGVEQELATGSGFWGFEPSITLIAPSDPAVFYANIGYLWNMEADIDKQIGNRVVQKVDPGDAIRFGAGMGLALNEKVSFSIGYQHDWILKTTTTFDDGKVDSPSLSVGSLTFGVNWQMSDSSALSVSVAVGVTEDAPDVRLMARVPITLDLF
ncbi:MAG: transporter [Magnetospirillum sp.]|nr:transporter [Magnetospirillum sp.]